ncbi:MAG: TatD family hydrolase [Clostridia bacterium]|nr:TatD family hydrolase [Clostridia bacterium]
MLFDSHAHLDDDRFLKDRDEVINSLKDSGVSYVVNVGADLNTSLNSVNLANKYDFIYAAIGVHPYDAATVNGELLEKLKNLSKQNKKIVAIGESGLDYSYDEADKEVQKKAFIKHILLANELNLPIIVHNRDSHKDMLDILANHKPENAIIHCYSGSLEMAKILVNMGYYISFSGTVTFKNAKNLKEVAKFVPDDKLLIETDCPYLSPEPERGTRNNPAKVRYTAEVIAQLRGTTFEEIAKHTLLNAKRVYKIS